MASIKDRIQEMKDNVDSLQERIKDSINAVNRLEGEEAQLLDQKNNIEEQIQDEFDCSVIDLKKKVKRWIKENEQLTLEIKDSLEAIEVEEEDTEDEDDE